MKRFGLRQRFLLLILSIFLVLFAIVAAMLVVRKASSERTSLNQQTKSFAMLATKPIGDAFVLYKDSGSIRIQQQVEKFTELDPDITDVSIADTKGNILFSSDRVPRVSSAQAETFTPIYEQNHGVITKAVVPLIEDFGVHRYSMIYTVSDQRIVDDISHTVAITIILSVMAFTLALFLTYRLIDELFLSPVSTISAKALAISGGNLEDQIQLNRKDELGDLASAVNTMANSLKADIVKLREADQLKTEFITIASHNLRTPLTSIKGNIELMEDTGVPGELQQMLAAVSDGAVRLSTMIEDLLAISTVESGKLTATQMSPAPIKPLLQSVADLYGESARQKKLDFNVRLDLVDQTVAMNQHLLKIALANLLENAFKFTKEGGVEFAAAVQGDSVVISVADTGIGIAADEVPKLFTKFHRGTSVMKYNYEGTGIGLYLTKLIIDQHRGSIAVDSQEGQGTTFTVKLPLATIG